MDVDDVFLHHLSSIFTHGIITGRKGARHSAKLKYTSIAGSVRAGLAFAEPSRGLGGVDWGGAGQDQIPGICHCLLTQERVRRDGDSWNGLAVRPGMASQYHPSAG